MAIKVEYVWLDGSEPTQKLRTKTKILYGKDALFENLENVNKNIALEAVPDWSFDGSSTNQTIGSNSDCKLQPIKLIKNPIVKNSIIVLCEVLNPDNTTHSSNMRRKLVDLEDKYQKDFNFKFGIEQEYVLINENEPYRWYSYCLPEKQGQYYCSVGYENAWGQEVAESHLDLCLNCNLDIAGTNAEVMPAQWEFQTSPLSPLECADQLWLMRYILLRIAEINRLSISFHPKPKQGDWNGSGAHTNFSTKQMMEKNGLKWFLNNHMSKFEKNHDEHIKVYGHDNQLRLTGKHETCSIHEFRYGVSDRGASIRIPMQTNIDGFGYLEDRRPAANMDPYQVIARIIETVVE
jgi:glutamine synthetase